MNTMDTVESKWTWPSEVLVSSSWLRFGVQLEMDMVTVGSFFFTPSTQCFNILRFYDLLGGVVLKSTPKLVLLPYDQFFNAKRSQSEEKFGGTVMEPAVCWSQRD